MVSMIFDSNGIAEVGGIFDQYKKKMYQKMDDLAESLDPEE